MMGLFRVIEVHDLIKHAETCIPKKSIRSMVSKKGKGEGEGVDMYIGLEGLLFRVTAIRQELSGDKGEAYGT